MLLTIRTIEKEKNYTLEIPNKHMYDVDRNGTPFTCEQPNLHKFGSFIFFSYRISPLFNQFPQVANSCWIISQLYRKISVDLETICLIEKKSSLWRPAIWSLKFDNGWLSWNLHILLVHFILSLYWSHVAWPKFLLSPPHHYFIYIVKFIWCILLTDWMYLLVKIAPNWTRNHFHMGEHLRDIRNQIDSPIANQFNLLQHSIQDIHFQLIQILASSPDLDSSTSARRKCEMYWIYKLVTHSTAACDQCVLLNWNHPVT